MREPASSVTNAAYGLAGILLLLEAGGPTAAAFVASCILLAIGSGLYHRFGGWKCQALDEVSMYAVAISIIALGLAPWFGQVAAVSIWFTWSFASAVWYDRLPSGVYLPILVVVGVITVAVHAGALWGVGLLAGFALAALVRSWGERAHDSGRHRSADLFHAGWHIVTAVVIHQAAALLV